MAGRFLLVVVHGAPSNVRADRRGVDEGGPMLGPWDALYSLGVDMYDIRYILFQNSAYCGLDAHSAAPVPVQSGFVRLALRFSAPVALETKRLARKRVRASRSAAL